MSDKREATEQEWNDAAKQLTNVLNSGDTQILTHLLSDEQVIALATDYKEGKES